LPFIEISELTPKHFTQLKEAMPQSVQNLRVSNESPSSVELQWQKPRMLHGRLKHYSIKYQHRSYVACEGLLANSSSNGSLTATKTSVTVTDLLPHSLYSFAVSAVNTKFESKPQKQYVTTLPLHEIQDDEIPRIIDIVPSNNSAIINISQINCTKMRGTLSVLVIPTCVNEWCHKHQTVNYQLPRKQLFLNDYKTNLKFCGNSRKCRDTEEKQFKTRPGEPSEAPYDLKLNWTMKNDLELQWKHPNKSNGEIQYFRIELITSNSKIIRKQLSVTEDTYSLNYYYKIDNKELHPTTQYQINIAACNKQIGKELIKKEISPPDIPSVLKTPEIYSSNDSITIKIQINRPRGFHNNYELIVLVPNQNPNTESHPKLENFDLGNLRTVSKCSIINFDQTHVLVIGDHNQPKNCDEISNPPLDADTSYNITMILINTFQNESRYKNKYSKSIKITEFEDYVKNSIKNGELERQHALFPRGQTKPWTYGVVKENKSKNRYNNLIAYDHSRVILEKVNGNPHSDYINANYIDGYKISKAYIATQGPKSSTLFDFWRMIWQENTQCIAMLANVYESGKKKVEKYWPAINETLKFGDISIRYVSHKVYADFEHRVFQISRKKQTRKVEQLHFSSWPDHGVPLYSQSLVSLLQKILKLPLSSKSPLVVHCSAGVGRTGTILLCDICLRMAAREGSIDVLRWLQKLREQRPNLVDNVEQYKLAHLVILECLFGKQTAIPCNDIDESVEKLLQSGEIKSQMEYLKKTRWQDDAMKTTLASDTKIATVSGKNRFQDIIPEFQGQIFISRNPPDDEASSYINAIAVDGFRCPGRFIVTQQPLPNTLGDFWRLIDEKDVSVIISLNRINLKDKTSCNFWPISSNFQMNPIDHITLRNANTLSLECYDLVTIHMNTDSGKDRKVVEIFSLKHWPPKASFPKSMQKFLTFWEDSDAASRKSDTVVVTCYDGVKASGVYVAMSFIIEKMKLEQSCDVCQAVRTIRHNRNQFVQEEEQFAFLYRAAVDYINGFQSYANFS
ncbi:Y phosphatase and/or fn3 domain containing protein, partial [Asbolus verrucosus]